MGVFKNWPYMMSLMIIQLVGYFGWLCNFASAQVDLSESVTGSVNFPNIGIACLGNLAVFVTSLLRIRLDLEMGARDVLATIRGPKLEDIDRLRVISLGLTTCRYEQYRKASVVMLSRDTPNHSIRQFMRYISNAYKLESIILRFRPLDIAAMTMAIDTCHHCNQITSCGCIIFCTVEEIATMIDEQMPGILRRQSSCQWLLPSLVCLTEGCHGYTQGVSRVKETNEWKLEGDPPKVKFSSPLCEILHFFPDWIEERNTCICIPVPQKENDRWTHLLARSFGVTLTQATKKEELEAARENYSTASLIVPKFAEVLVNILLTGWFRVDGFSSALIARRAIKENVVDKQGNGFSPNAFLTKSLAKASTHDKSNVCQVLTFRSSLLGMRTFSFMVGCVNVLCSIAWALLVAMEEGAGKWYDTHSMPLSKTRVVVIMMAIAIASGMDCLHWYLGKGKSGQKFRGMVSVMIVLEIMCLATVGIAATTLGIKAFGKWLYSALHIFVWVKWAIGSLLLGECPPEDDTQQDFDNGILVHSSAFLLNSILAGVRGSWHYSLSMEN